MNNLIWTNTHGVDLTKGQGVIYFIRVVDNMGGEYRYIGRTRSAKTRLQSYVRIVKRIFNGQVRCKTKGQESYRAVHLALAKAVEHGWEYDFYPLQNVPVEALDVAESGKIRELECNLNKIGLQYGMVGTWSVEDYADLVLNDFVEAYTRQDPYVSELPDGVVGIDLGDGNEILIDLKAEHRKPKK